MSSDQPSAQPPTPSDLAAPLPNDEAPPAANAKPSAAASKGRLMDNRVSEIATLLKSLDDVAAESGLSEKVEATEHADRLVEARLGVASALYRAMRCKHAPTASHCLRVALGCSAWAEALKLPESYRDTLEIAALLHDVGKIGVPETVLLKPGKLQPDEVMSMARHRQLAIDIVSACTSRPEVLEILRYAPAWFDGSRHGFDKEGEEIPFGARMLAIVDAFDAMTTDHVYRPARSRERALGELFEYSGTQFDSKLIQNFNDVLSKDQQLLSKRVSRRWLTDLSEELAAEMWKPITFIGDETHDESVQRFEAKLIDTMHDGVVFVDNQLTIFIWNTGAERLTGISADAARGRVWTAELLRLRDASGNRIEDPDCPISRAVQSGVQSIHRLTISGRNDKDVTIDLHVVPVRGSDGAMLGASLLLHDASPEATLEERCQTLHDQATKDPLTQVANRAEFDRMHSLFIDAHLETGLPCSLIITDIDHFKYINDNFGHQAGDEVIVNLAGLLKSQCRAGDLVARYGGEEFVVLCADCNNAAAAKRAEQMRKKIAESHHPSLTGRRITASFGVTELQPGDTPETMLRRADRGLLQAKDQGRNQVIQLGDGFGETKTKRGWWPFSGSRNNSLIECNLITVVPIGVAVQKLRGFIADHSAKITSTGDDHLHLELSALGGNSSRRKDDRPIPFSIALSFVEQNVERTNAYGFARGSYAQTAVRVEIRPRRERDRRRDHAAHRASSVLASLKAYLMAKEESELEKAPQPSLADSDI